MIPTISLNDVNYDSCEVKLVRTRLGEKNVDVTAEFIKGLSEQAQGASGTFDTFKKLVENDGIYTLTLKMVDKAGNEESEEYTFTVNRFGSVYEYSDALVELIKDGGQYKEVYFWSKCRKRTYDGEKNSVNSCVSYQRLYTS